MSLNALESTLIITELKRNSLGRTEIDEYTTPPNERSSYSPAWPCDHSRFGRRSERLSRRLVSIVKPQKNKRIWSSEHMNKFYIITTAKHAI